MRLTKVVKHTRGRNHFSSDVDKAIDESEMIFIAVNTPTKTYGEIKIVPILKFVELCARTIAKVAKTDKIVVEKLNFTCKNCRSRTNYI